MIRPYQIKEKPVAPTLNECLFYKKPLFFSQNYTLSKGKAFILDIKKPPGLAVFLNDEGRLF
ncbi:MAG: hypothetical protein DSZ27_09735 [Thiomicrospira sp.]|nr:MAG: hypothetical protein DSZ27_09735 [Thiomicrospira sp.]